MTHKSDPRNYPFIEAKLRELAPRRVVDVGVGFGAIGRLARNACPLADIIGIEAWPDYLTRKECDTDAYTQIVVKDVRQVDASVWKGCWVTTWVDGPEHLPEDEALQIAMALIRRSFQGLLIACPIVDYPQGAVGGNPFEEHRSQWTAERWDELGAETLAVNDRTGVFWLTATSLGPMYCATQRLLERSEP